MTSTADTLTKPAPARPWQRAGIDGANWCSVAGALAEAGREVVRYPFCVRVLLENLLRHHLWSMGASVSRAEIDRLIDWQANEGADIALHVTRVVLPDSSGLPLLQDLAALRGALARSGQDPGSVETLLPVDLIVDHSLQVDHWGRPDAIRLNLRREFSRNGERYRFLKWAQQAFGGVRIFPPGSGIIHSINLERLATVVTRTERDGQDWVYPEFLLGCDSHTPMINALGILGWGVGGLDAEAALLGHAYTFPIPSVVGVRLTGILPRGTLSTDLALLVTQQLRREGVTACAVEFFGPAVAAMPLADRATLANMAPEYGATCGFFAVDARTIDYLRGTGREAAQVETIERYCRDNSLYREADASEPCYSRVIEIDVSQACPSMAGPRRPQDRLPIDEVAADFTHRLPMAVEAGGFARALRPGDSVGLASDLRDGSVVLAAITSCTNTTNPGVMLAAGLIARRAVELGLRPPPWVKTSLAPGSRAVTAYLDEAGLLAPLAAVGFSVIGYGCTTCGGKSGPLADGVAERIEADSLVAVAVLSSNRNFEGRVHKLARANYIGAPPWVVLYALAGRIDIDFEREPLGRDRAGHPVFARDLIPDADEIASYLPLAMRPELYRDVYGQAAADPEWVALEAPAGALYQWDPDSSYLVEPPFFMGAGDGGKGPAIRPGVDHLSGARVLVLLGDSVTTDHISPGGEIPAESAAGQYLRERGVLPADFNSYVGRRGNYHVMARATFANLRLRNLLAPGTEGGVTRHLPSDECMSVFDAAQRYRDEGVPAIVLAGRDYGTGSSRDWAAKGTSLLGVAVVIAESFERIHRANLIAMGVLPLCFEAGEGWRALGLSGEEQFEFSGIEAAVLRGEPVSVRAVQDGRSVAFEARAALLTQAERQLMRAGGIPASVLESFRRAA